MDYKQIQNMIESTGLPNVYHAFPVGAVPDLPYIVYEFPNSDNFGADDKVWQRVEALRIFLCTRNKDPETEKLLESILDNMSIYWEKLEDYTESESMYMIQYDMEVLITDGE